MNVYAEKARLEKVARMLALVPRLVAYDTCASPERVAGWLFSMSRRDRAKFAIIAGVNEPSEETWTMFVDAVRRGLAVVS